MRLNNITKFVLTFCAVYFTAVALHESQSVRKAHAKVFTVLEEFTFNMFNPHYRVDFGDYKQLAQLDYRPDLYDFSMTIFDRKRWRQAPMKSSVKPISMLNGSIDTMSIGPILLLIALIVATPTSWRRKLLYLAIGVFLSYILIALKYSHMFYENLDTYQPSGLWGLLSTTFGKAFRSHEFMLFNVLFIWVVIAIRKKELDWLLNW